MEHDARIFIAGSDTLLGLALVRRFTALGFHGLVGVGDDEPDLHSFEDTSVFFERAEPQYVFVACGESGGIAHNQHCPADLMIDNLTTTLHVLQAARQFEVRKLLYLGSSCCYPRDCAQPMRADDLLTGAPEPTNRSYSMAKLAGMELCRAIRAQSGRNWVAAIPTNVFGPGDHFDVDRSHVVGALIRRLHNAKQLGRDSVAIWGSGEARREFLFVDDLADACDFVMRNYSDAAPINLGGGGDLSIRQLAESIADVVGYTGRLEFDSSKPDGMPRKMLDSAPLFALGWRPKIALHEALAQTYRWFVAYLAAGASADPALAV